MAAIKDEAIVLRRLDYSETSQVLVFLTRENGLRRLIAKGIRRGTKNKFAVGVDLLERGHLAFIAKSQGAGNLGTLTEWRQTDGYTGLRNELRRLYGGQYAAEIVASIVEEADPHPDLFDAMTALLASLAGGGDVLGLLVGFQREVLESVGLWPDLTRCVVCDKPAPSGAAGYFAVHQGGLVCRHCEPAQIEKRKVSGKTLTALRDGTFDESTARDAFDLLNHTISHAIGRQPATAKFVVRKW